MESTSSSDPTDLLKEALEADGGPNVELRYHSKRTRSVSVENGRVDQARLAEHAGVGVRVQAAGIYGFASTASLEVGAIRAAVEDARAAAVASAESGKGSGETRALPPVDLAQGCFSEPGFEELQAKPIEDRLDWVLGIEARTRAASASIQSAVCRYAEVFEEKGIVTSDGAKAWTRLVRPEFATSAVAAKDGEIQRGARSVGSTGAWDCLFRRADPEQYSEEAAAMAVNLLRAGHVEGGRKRVILSPSLVGLLTHEAIGHTVEADFVAAGSCAQGRMGQQVASELVTLCDSGASEYLPGAGGTLAVDDEGVLAGRTEIIRAGVLTSYLHDRRSAAEFGVPPTGNARAWEYDDAPLIRMRNTYIEPGTSSLEEMIAATEDGLLLDGPKNGQADANGEFMFGTLQAWPIKRGVRGELLRGTNISGTAFDVLRSVTAVGGEFEWDLGSGHCGKGQPMKVDAGGPWLACEVLVGGQVQ